MNLYKGKYLKVSILVFLVYLFGCNTPGHLISNHAELNFWTVGNSIEKRFGGNFYTVLDRLEENKNDLDRFLLSIADQPLTVEQIQDKSNLTQSRINYLITNLDSIHLLKKDDEDRWAPVIPVISDDRMKTIREDLTSMAHETAQYLMDDIPKIKRLYYSIKSPSDPSWDNIAHLIIDKFIIDATFHININILNHERISRMNGDNYKSMTCAFFLELGKHLSTFGCNWYFFRQNENQREVYVLHGAILDRFDISMNKYRHDKQFGSGLFNIAENGGIDSLTYREKEILKELNWASEDSLWVPVIKAKTIKQLWTILEESGKNAAEVAFKYFDDITDSYNKSSLSQFLEYDEDYIQVCIHALFSLIVEELEKNGVVPPIPDPVPDSFGVYFVLGKMF